MEAEHQLAAFAMPELNLGELLCVGLGEAMKTPLRAPLRRGLSIQRSIVSTKPPGAIWSGTLKTPLPTARDFLKTTGDKPFPPEKRRKTRASPPIPTPSPTAERVDAWGAYAEPTLWWGEPPFPSARDRILGIPWMGIHNQDAVWSGEIARTRSFIFRSGLIIVCETDQFVAQQLINQLFGTLQRCGVSSYAVPLFEMISFTGVDPATGKPGGSHAAVTTRNRLLGIDFSTQRSTTLSYCLPIEDLDPIMMVVDRCASSAGDRQRALGLLSATTLLLKGHFNESFLTAWTLLESVVGERFERLLLSLGWSHRRIREMEYDWKVSQQVDLLAACNDISTPDQKELHGLRKIRNGLVHELDDVERAQADRCVQYAQGMLALPAPSHDLNLKMSFL
jgi:hypothetical protein